MISGARVVELEPRHARIVPYVREADRAEVWASAGCSVASAVAFSIATSRIGWAVEIEGEPVAIFGVGDAVGGGVPWLLATDAVERFPVHFYRVSKGIVAGMRRRYDYLENYVDARNTLSIRWLKWAGFAVEDPEPFGAAGVDFHRFWWRNRSDMNV